MQLVSKNGDVFEQLSPCLKRGIKNLSEFERGGHLRASFKEQGGQPPLDTMN